MKKHAYLIMAHNQPDILKTLLELIDDKRNDIYLHLDVKFNMDVDELLKSVQYSKLFLVPRLNVVWGAYSQIQCEYMLFQKASENGRYTYYHLLSGVDLPVKTQDYIHAFFENNQGKEFVSFDDDCMKLNWHRVKYRWFLQEKKGYKKKNLYNCLDKLIILSQKAFKIDVSEKDIEYKLGSNWISISDSFARYLLQKRNYVDRLFAKAANPDEMFVQTILFNSDYLDKLYTYSLDANLRFYDFPVNSASPRTIIEKDILQLVESKYLFARKFDAIESIEGIKLLRRILLEGEG